MKASEILRRAAARWERAPARGWLARDKHGGACGLRSPDAVSWCAIGAIRFEAREAQWYACFQLLEGAADAIAGQEAFRVNDLHPELMPDVWSEAIEAAEAFEEAAQ